MNKEKGTVHFVSEIEEMNFNHLLPKHELLTKCVGEKQHSYMPTSHIEATIGHVAIRFRCKNCNKLTTVFLSDREYRTHEKVLDRFGV